MRQEKFNSSNQMEERFQKVLANDFEGASVGSVKKAMDIALGPLPYAVWPVDKSWAVIRARSLNPSIEDISKSETFSAPPAIHTSQGRANLVNFPVFYGTFDSRTAMHEINVSLGTECYISIWEYTKKTPLLTTFLEAAYQQNDLYQLNGWTSQALVDTF